MANRSWLFGIWPVLFHDAVGAATNRSESVLEGTYQEHTIEVGDRLILRMEERMDGESLLIIRLCHDCWMWPRIS